MWRLKISPFKASQNISPPSRNIFSKFGFSSPISRPGDACDTKRESFSRRTYKGDLDSFLRNKKSKPLIIWEMINYVKFCCARKSWPSLEEFVGVLNSLFPDFCRIFLIWTTNHNENGKIKEIIDTHLMNIMAFYPLLLYKIESGSKIKMEIWRLRCKYVKSYNSTRLDNENICLYPI